MGWSEREFYESSPESVYYAFQGYFNKREADEKVFRNLGWINYKSAGGKSASIEKFWPIGKPSIEPRNNIWGETDEEAKANYQAILKAHKINGH